MVSPSPLQARAACFFLQRGNVTTGRVAKSVDARDLKSLDANRAGSIPAMPTS